MADRPNSVLTDTQGANVPSVSPDLSLDQILARLARHERVEGLLHIGSLARGALAPASDYDLVIVLRDAVRPWYVGVTQVEGRLTDLILVSASEIDRLLALDAPIAAGHELAPIVRWARDGLVVYDRSGRLRRVQRKLGQGEWVEPIDGEAAYGSWFALNYNLVQARRLLAVDDPLYRTTVLIRMALYGHMDLWLGYFGIRQLSFEGDKAAVRYLRAHDEAFLDAYLAFIAETDAERKYALYVRAAALVAAPLGGLWPPGHTVMNVKEAAGTWQALLGETDQG